MRITLTRLVVIRVMQITERPLLFMVSLNHRRQCDLLMP